MATLTQSRDVTVSGGSPQRPASDSNLRWKWVAVLLPGAAIYFIRLGGLSDNQRHLLAIFLATIIGLVVRPVAMGLMAFVGLSSVAITRTIPANIVLSGF